MPFGLTCVISSWQTSLMLIGLNPRWCNKAGVGRLLGSVSLGGGSGTLASEAGLGLKWLFLKLTI